MNYSIIQNLNYFIDYVDNLKFVQDVHFTIEHIKNSSIGFICLSLFSFYCAYAGIYKGILYIKAKSMIINSKKADRCAKFYQKIMQKLKKLDEQRTNEKQTKDNIIELLNEIDILCMHIIKNSIIDKDDSLDTFRDLLLNLENDEEINLELQDPDVFQNIKEVIKMEKKRVKLKCFYTCKKYLKKILG